MRWGWVVRARGRGLAGEVVEEPVPPLKLLDGGGEVGHGPPVSQEPVHKAAREDATKVGCDHYKKERERGGEGQGVSQKRPSVWVLGCTILPPASSVMTWAS